MLFNSLEFLLIFLPLVILAFYSLEARFPRLTYPTLVVASFLFYAYWDIRYVPLLLGSIICNYCFLRIIANETNARISFIKTAFAIICNLSVLAYFKYANFSVDVLNTITSSNYPPLHDLGLPIGISFFTLQQIAFLVDLHHRTKTPNYNLTQYGLFVSFFPQLIAGPIVHHSEMLTQLTSPQKQKWVDNLSIGSSYFTFGLAKKILLADHFAKLASPVFDSAATGIAPDFFQSWSAAIAYTLQLYFDFSGYSDMAIGLGLMFGLTLPINFCSPYRATSIIDFWRRWHITLSRFVRDDIYIPLGGNKRGLRRTLLNAFIAMTVVGVWHGAGWTFILWGILHGTAITVNRLYQKLRQQTSPNRLWGWGGTFLFLILSWTLFRAETVDSAMLIYKGMICGNGFNLPQSLESYAPQLSQMLHGLPLTFEGVTILQPRWWLSIIGAMALILFFPSTQSVMNNHVNALQLKGYPTVESSDDSHFPLCKIKWEPNIAWAIVIGTLACTVILQIAEIDNASEFLYFQF